MIKSRRRLIHKVFTFTALSQCHLWQGIFLCSPRLCFFAQMPRFPQISLHLLVLCPDGLFACSAYILRLVEHDSSAARAHAPAYFSHRALCAAPRYLRPPHAPECSCGYRGSFPVRCYHHGQSVVRVLHLPAVINLLFHVFSPLPFFVSFLPASC